MIAPGEQSLLLSSKVRRRKGGSLPESCQTFEVAEARTSGPVNLFSLVKLVFFESEHPFTDKPLVITEPAVPSVRLLSLGSKLYRSIKQRMLN